MKNYAIFLALSCALILTLCGSATAATTPTANFTSNITNGSAPLNVQFNDTSTGNSTSWNWIFGDGNTSTQQNPTNTYTQPGTYNVSLTVANNAGNNTLTQTNYITVLSNNDYVSPTGSDTTGTGTIKNPYATIKNGLNNVAAGGILNLLPGTYTGTGNVGLTITKNVNIIGTSQNNTIINAVCLNNVFSVNSGVNVTIANLTFANGTTSDGGAIYNLGTLTVNNCTFTGNTGTSTDYNYGGGGAIYNNGGTSTVNNCIFTGNTVIWYGGAIYNNGGTSTVNNCTFTGNTATSCGGAIYNNGGTSTVNNCTFTGNTVKNSYGGAYVNNAGTSNVTNSSFIGNTALTFGGAVSNYASMNVSNCIFTNNTVQRGGAFYNAVGTLTVTYSSFVNNSAYDGGSAIYRKSGTVNAQYNWWGSNSNPSSQFYSTVTYTNWLYMTETVTPSTIINGSTATVTVSFNNIYNGSTVIIIDPASGHIVDGTVVNFSSPLGTFSPATMVTANGIATTTFTGATLGSDVIMLQLTVRLFQLM